MKRSRSRNRGASGGGAKPQQNANRAFDSNGPENVKVRGHAQTVFEKYQQLARDAASAGDRVLAENHLQHAEHYFRVLRAVQPNRPVTEIMGRDAFTSGLDIDFEDESLNQPAPEAAEGEGADGGEPRAEQRSEQRPDYNRDPRQDYSREPKRDYTRDRTDRNGGNRYEGQRDQRGDQQSRNDQQPRGEQPRADRPDSRRDDRPRNERYEDKRDFSRDERSREDRDETRGERNGERAPGMVRDPLPVVRPESTRLTAAAPAEDGSPLLRGQDGAVSSAPAFLQVRAEAAPIDDASAAPKRTRARRKPAAAAAAPAETAEEV